MKKLIILYFIILCAVNSNAYSAMFSYETLMNQHSDHITNIQTIGNWKYTNQKGFFRIIYVEYLYGCSWLYIQWMKEFSGEGFTEIIKNISIYDNDHHDNTFDKPRIIENEKGILIEYNADSGHDQKKYRIEIQVFNEPGQYKLRSTKR